jgi:hypothetical protein
VPPSSARSDPSPRYETTVPLVSRALALFVGLTSVPVFVLVAALTYVENDPWWVVALAALLLFGPIPLLNRLRFEVELADDELRYRVRPWHLRPRTVRLESITGVERLSRRPDPSPSLRRVNLGRGWVDWTDEEVRYVLGDDGVRITHDGSRTVELWFPGVDELARALDDVRDSGWSHRGSGSDT